MGSEFQIKKFFRRYLKIIADIKEGFHRWIILSTFNTIDIVGTLADGQAHISGRNALIYS